MTKKNMRQRHNRRPSLPMIMLGLGGLLLLAMAGFMLFQNNDTGGGTPRLAVDQEKIDWGTIQDYTKKVITIKVTNTGDGILRFREKPYVQVVEGCCPPDMQVSSPRQPGHRAFP